VNILKPHLHQGKKALRILIQHYLAQKKKNTDFERYHIITAITVQSLPAPTSPHTPREDMASSPEEGKGNI